MSVWLNNGIRVWVLRIWAFKLKVVDMSSAFRAGAPSICYHVQCPMKSFCLRKESWVYGVGRERNPGYMVSGLSFLSSRWVVDKIMIPFCFGYPKY